MNYLANPVHYFQQCLLASPQKRLIIGLAGLPGSGKTTLVKQWKAALDQVIGHSVVEVLSMDGFHFSKAELAQFPDPEAAFRRRGAPWTFDIQAFLSKLRQLRTADQRTILWPDFEHDVGDPITDAIHIQPECRLIMVEGLYLLYRDEEWQALGECFDSIGYLDTPLSLSLSRLVTRHQQAWGISQQEAQAHIARNDRLNAEIVAACRHQADWLIKP